MTRQTEGHLLTSILSAGKELAVAFFNFINNIDESTSIVITTNKKRSEWAKILDDEVIPTALLDRLLDIPTKVRQCSATKYPIYSGAKYASQTGL